MGETVSGGHRYSEIQCFQLIYRNIAETVPETGGRGCGGAVTDATSNPAPFASHFWERRTLRRSMPPVSNPNPDRAGRANARAAPAAPEPTRDEDLPHAIAPTTTVVPSPAPAAATKMPWPGRDAERGSAAASDGLSWAVIPYRNSEKQCFQLSYRNSRNVSPM